MKPMFTPKRRLIAGLLALALAGTPPAVRASDERESLEMLRETTLNLIDALVDGGVFTREKADELVKAAQARAAGKAARQKAAAPATVRVQYVPETVKNEIREQLRQEVLAQAKQERWAEPNAVPSWLDRIKWEGDLRLRYQSDKHPDSNADPLAYIFATLGGSTRAPGFLAADNLRGATANTQEDRNRLRLRARLGLLARVSDEWSAGIRLATGSETDRVSTNQTLGQDFNKYAFHVDRAYLKYEPAEWLSLYGGRIPNPWFSTDLVWDEDLSFEGVAATVRPVLAEGAVRPFLTVGAFPIRESNPTASGSRWMQGVQAGAKLRLGHRSQLTLGAALYRFDGIEGKLEADPNLSYVPEFGQYEYGRGLRQKGNTLFYTDSRRTDGEAPQIWGLASRFRPLNLTASLDLAHFDPVHVILTADYVKNTQFDRNEMQRRTGLRITDGKDYGYQYRLTVGMPKLENQHDWQASFSYRYLGSDAVLDAFTDSDFGLGGTNLKGYQVAFQYGVQQNAWLGLRWLSAESIDSFAPQTSYRYAVDVLQADVNVRF